ncbi:MAG: restriction endonuclease [Candidatus Absconditicoccaceae bacterium]
MIWQQIKIKSDIVDRYKEFLRFPDRINRKQYMILLRFMYELTDVGFEYYVRDYFKIVEKCEVALVTGGFNDGCIDVRCKRGDENIAIQCKKFGKSHVKQEHILYFVEKVKEIKAKLGKNLSLYYITTSWANGDSRKTAQVNGVNLRYYKDILKMNKHYNIGDFIKNNESDDKIVSGINVDKILAEYYYRRYRGPLRKLAYVFVNRILKVEVDYERIGKMVKEGETNGLVFVNNKNYISKKYLMSK